MISDHPLQFCSAGKEGTEYLTDFQFLRSVTCTYADAVGGLAIFALLVYVGIGARVYIKTGSLMIPLGLLLMGGGAMLTQMDAVATPFAILLLLGPPSALIAYVYYRYSL